MSRIRLLLAWLVMAAIPLQGLAAASMLYCGMGPSHTASAAAGTQAHHSSGAPTISGHDHAAQLPMAPSEVSPTGHDVTSKLPDATHKCGVCASCCHSVAIAELPQLAVFAPVPQLELAEPLVLIHARPSPVPDKPPRA